MKLITTTLLVLFCNSLYAQYCAVDSSFDFDGRITNDFVGNQDIIAELIPLPDNKLIAVGYAGNGLYYNVGMVKYNYDGSLDASFGIDGKLLDAPINVSLITFDAVLQNDSQIIVGGSWSEDGQDDLFLARYHISGYRDLSFGIDGYVRINLGDHEELIANLAMQTDGKIIAAGKDYNGINYNCFVARFNEDGILDNTFGSDGIQHISITKNGDFVQHILIQPDDKIVGCGYGLNFTTNYNFIGFRLTAYGELDSTFNETGKFEYDFELSSDIGVTVAIQTDGKLLFGGATNSKSGIIRLLENGIIDSTFGDNGKFILPNTLVNELLVDADQQIIGAGIYFDIFGNADFSIFRTTSMGLIDATFGTSGVIQTDLGNDFEGSRSISFLNDGKIVSGGYSGTDFIDFAVVRYVYDEIVAVQENYITSPQLHIYPNPTSGILNIKGIWDANDNITIFNVEGNPLTTFNVNEYTIASSEINYTFPASIPNGIYFIEIADENSVVITSASVILNR